MLNNINGKGLSKSTNVDDLNIPGATSGDIADKIDDVLEGKPELLIVHIGTNDLTNNVNLLSNAKKIVNKVKNTSDTALIFSNIIIRIDKKFKKDACRYKFSTKKFLQPKKYKFDIKRQHKKSHLGIKKLHLDRKGRSIFAKKY